MSSQPSLASAWARAWRVPATGLCFACFGLGGLLMGVLAFPLLNLVVRDRVRRVRWSRALVGASFRGFVALMTLLGLVRVRWIGAERLQRRGLLVLANHPTLIDVVALIARTPNADCIVRAGLHDNLFTSGPVRACNYLRNDSGSAVLEGFRGSLDSGSNLVIFPEGTRSQPGRAMHLQRGPIGAAHGRGHHTGAHSLRAAGLEQRLAVVENPRLSFATEPGGGRGHRDDTLSRGCSRRIPARRKAAHGILEKLFFGGEGRWNRAWNLKSRPCSSTP
jgi:hypothetical protein